MEAEIEINTYLSFIIDNEHFAVNVAKVLEVLQTQKITRVPNVADDIKGVLNFRGEIIPIFETRKRFGLPDRQEDEKYVVIVLEVTANETTTIIGAIADSVKDVFEIDLNEVLDVPKMSSKINVELITGILKLKEEFIMLLNVDKLFSDKEIDALNNIVVR